MEYNTELDKIYKCTQSLESGNFTAIATEANLAYSELIKSMSNTIDELRMPETWNDSISTEVGSSVKSCFDEIVKICSESVDNVIVPTGGKVTSLNEAIKAHEKNVDLYNNEEIAKNNTAKEQPIESNYKRTGTREDGTTYTYTSSQYETDCIIWEKRMQAHNTKLENYRKEAEKWENEGLKLKTEMQALLVPVGSASGGGVTSSSSTFEEDLGNGMTKSGTKIFDAEGNLEREIYQIVDTSGQVVQSGMATYQADGSKTESYDSNYNGSNRSGYKVYNSDGVVISEEYESTYENGSIQSGTVTYDLTTGQKTDVYKLETKGEDGQSEVREGTVTYDKDNAVVSEVYEAKLSNGVTQSGEVQYNIGGTKTETYKINYSDGNQYTGIKKYDKNGNVLMDSPNNENSNLKIGPANMDDRPGLETGPANMDDRPGLETETSLIKGGGTGTDVNVLEEK